MAITVDDLPVHGALPFSTNRIDVAKKMLASFKAAGVPEAYGFINSERLEKNPGLSEVYDFWIKNGYPLGSPAFLLKLAVSCSIKS